MPPIDFHRIALFPGHLRAFSGRVTVGVIEETPMGVADFHAPPLAAPGLRLRFHLRDPETGAMARDVEPRTPGYRGMILLQRGSWHHDRIARESVHHRPIGGRHVALALRQDLIALGDRSAVLIDLSWRDLGSDAGTLLVTPDLTVPALARVPAHSWTWFPPRFTNAVRVIGPFTHQGDDAVVRLRATAPLRDGGFELAVTRGGAGRISFLLELLGPNELLAQAWNEAEADAARRAAERNQQSRLHWVANALPSFTCGDERANAWYARAASGALTVRWDHPAFVARPLFSEAGLDGGGVCSYLWDTMYLSRIFPLLADRDAIRRLLVQFLLMKPEAHFAFDPLEGKGFGPCYALNAYSLARLFRDYVAYHQDWQVLIEPVGGQPLVDRLEQLSRFGDRSPLAPLIDYGDTTHLLEMRTAGYEHIVPSPNAERIWVLRFVAAVRERMQLAGAAALRVEAQSIERALYAHLWDAEQGWFRSRSKDGTRAETVFSVQVLTVLGMDLLPPELLARIVAHVRDGEFLGSHGLHSVSLADRLHYESGDVDWGGGGCYVGQAGLLLHDLYRMGEWQRAEELLRRISWWADVFPYFPQSIRADRPAYCDFDRPNCISALAGVQAIVAGLCGIECALDGRLVVDPRPHGTGHYTVHGYRFGDHVIDVDVDRDRYRVSRDGSILAEHRVGEPVFVTR